MSLPPKKPAQRALRDDAAMSFKEIGEHLGITRCGAAFICNNALRKIRRDREAVAKLQNLIELRRREKDRRAA